MSITASSTWAELSSHQQASAKTHLRDLFANDPKRVESLTLSFDGIHYDFSKQRVTTETLGLLVKLAKEARVADRAERMFAGDKINVSEGRSVLHVALRRSTGPFPGRQFDVMPEVLATRERMAEFASRHLVPTNVWMGVSVENADHRW